MVKARKKSSKLKARPKSKPPKHVKREIIFVGVSNPAEIRTSFLDGRKTAFETMKLFQELMLIRKHKAGLKVQLRKQIRAISSTISHLTHVLPKVHVHEELPEVPEPKKAPEPPPPPKRQPTEIERIEAGLREIENQLANLTQ